MSLAKTQPDPAVSSAQLRILSLTSLYPKEKQPRHGIFVEHRLHALAQEPSVGVHVVAPVPW